MTRTRHGCLMGICTNICVLPSKLPSPVKCFALSALALTFGCRAGTDSRSERSTTYQEVPAPADSTTPSGEPIEVPGSFAAARAFYQSRNVLSLSINSGAIKLGDQFSLVNETTNTTVIAHESSGLALNGEDATSSLGWSLDPYDITLKLYLADPALAESFLAGENILRLSVDSDSDEGRTAKAVVTLRDFSTFAFTTGVFDSDEQRSRGFQGSFEPVTRAVVTSQGETVMTTGFISITNY